LPFVGCEEHNEYLTKSSIVRFIITVGMHFVVKHFNYRNETAKKRKRPTTVEKYQNFNFCIIDRPVRYVLFIII